MPLSRPYPTVQIYMTKKSSGPSTDPWDTPETTGKGLDWAPPSTTDCAKMWNVVGEMLCEN